MDTDTSFLLSSPHCFSHWYLLSTGEQGIILCALEMEGLQIRYSNGVQAHSLHSISWFHQFTKTTFTDYFSYNTKHLLNIFFILTTKEFIQTTNNVSIKTTVFFYEHWRGFIQRKRRKFLITLMVINIEAATPGQTKDLSSLTSSLWKWLLSPLCMKMLFRPKRCIPASPSDDDNTLHYSWRLVRHSEKRYKSKVLPNDGLHNWTCNLIV